MRGPLELAETGKLPDLLIRLGIRQLNDRRLRDEARGGVEAQQRRLQAFLARAARSPIAESPAAANAQHYEVPAAFFRSVLGPHLKYSSALFPPGVHTLADAERAMLDLTAERAEVRDGMRVLDLGCGWGSFTLFLLQRFPAVQVVAVSNSHSQREYILARARELCVADRLEVVTCDVNQLRLDGNFDRIVSVEMLEHVKNHDHLFRKLAAHLQPSGKCFFHIFCHRRFAYAFEAEGDDNWMGRHFFTGGSMPSFDYLLHFQSRWQLERRWAVSGRHYARTASMWLSNLDARRDQVRDVFRGVYPELEAERWIQRWRIFFMACEELWGYRGGDEWLVGHYLFSRSSQLPV